MKTFIMSFIMAFGLGQISLAASTDKNLIELGSIYHEFKDEAQPTEEIYAKIAPMLNTELKFVASFVREAITTNGKILSAEFLRMPDDKTLKYIYTIQHIDWNMSSPRAKANADILVDLSLKRVNHIDMVDSYYDILFHAVSAKTEHVDMGSINFVLNNYNLNSDVEKAIFFFKAMDVCGKKILTEASAIDPNDQALALTYFDKFPKFNGLPYYQYKDFNFESFKLRIAADRGEENYKLFYLNRYYDVLLWHAECLSSKKKFKDQRADLIANSVLTQKEYYAYSANRNMVEAVAMSLND